MRRAQAKADRALNENEARAALRRRLNEAEEAVSKYDARQESIPKPQPAHPGGGSGGVPPASRRPAEVVFRGQGRHAAIKGRHS